jgi:hypothetical protein
MFLLNFARTVACVAPHGTLHALYLGVGHCPVSMQSDRSATRAVDRSRCTMDCRAE